MDDNVIVLLDVYHLDIENDDDCIFIENADDIIMEDTVRDIPPVKEKVKMGIAVNGSGSTSRNFIIDPYFKIFNGKSLQHSTKIGRIYILRPEYVRGHRNSNGATNWKLNETEKKFLMKILKSPADKLSRGTVWDAILRECISESMDEIDRLDFDKNRFLITPMPDYTKLP